jgi:hypothetical protein
MNLIRRDEHKNRCAAVVPESAMKARNLRNVNSFYYLEVNERSIPSAKNPIKLQQVKGTPQDVPLRSIHTGRVQLRFAGEKRPRLSISDPKGLSPIVRRYHMHHFTTDDP